MFRFDSFNKKTDDDDAKSFLKRFAGTEGRKKTINTSSFSIPMPTNSWGMLALSRLQEDSSLDDIVELLLNKDKATLLLPVSIPSLSSAMVDREFIMDHVVVYNSSSTNQVITLGGIRGIFQRDQLIALGFLPSENEISALMTDANKKSLFDVFNLDPSSVTPDHPKYNILASHVQLPLRESNLINVMLIQKPLSKKDVMEWLDTRSKNLEFTEHSLDDPLHAKVEEFIKSMRKNQPRSLDQTGSKVVEFVDSMRDLMNKEENQEERLDRMETYICSQLYDSFFTNPDGDEAMQDEALESRIAALNLLDLNLHHLGVTLTNQNDSESINATVKEAGTQLQQLNSIMGAKDKLDAIVKTHEIIVGAIEAMSENKNSLDGEAEVVQEMKQVISTVDTLTASADVLLPLLIFTIVKSNPTNFLSNLKFIQRYRRHITGQESYCLTNMMAAVSFLEMTNLVGLGLSADRVFSHITDLNATKVTTPPNSNNNNNNNNNGLKIVSDVMDSSYRVFDGIGKLWQRGGKDEDKLSMFEEVKNQVKDRVKKVNDIPAKDNSSELKDIASTSTHREWDSVLPSFMDRSKKGEGPMQKFLQVKSVDELKIGDVKELLADYKRLAAIMKQAGLA